MLTLGIDTSNYTTSACLYDSESGEVVQKKLLLPVKKGEKGLRRKIRRSPDSQNFVPTWDKVRYKSARSIQFPLPEPSAYSCAVPMPFAV